MSHTFQIEFDADPLINVSGKLSFCDGHSCVEFEEVGKMKLKQNKKLHNLLEVFSNFNSECGVIKKIELNEDE